MKKILLIISILFFTQTLAWAYLGEYGPFEPNAVPKIYPLQECACISGKNDKNNVFALKENSAHRIIVAKSDKDEWFGYIVTMKDTSGNVLLKPCEIGGYQGFSPNVYTALLNEDKEPDYLIVTWSGGCGIGAGMASLSFLLSCDNGYQLAKVVSFYPDETCFVDLNRDEKPELIHTDFVHGEKGKDGKIHNYWVYNLFQFKGTKIVLANTIDKRFPCWIWYKFKPNHKNTTQLSSDQKSRLWKKQKFSIKYQE